MKIEKYSFGKIVIDTVEHRSDLIITPDKQLVDWWRKSSHQVLLEDLISVFEQNLAMLIIGTGFYGLMKVEKEVREYCKSKEIKLLVNKTSKAIENFNSTTNSNVAAAFHLSC